MLKMIINTITNDNNVETYICNECVKYGNMENNGCIGDIESIQYQKLDIKQEQDEEDDDEEGSINNSNNNNNMELHIRSLS